MNKIRIDQAPCGNWILNGPTKEENYITPEDRLILRELSSRLAEYASRDIEEEKAMLWTAHNDLKPTRPLIYIDPENGWNELISFDRDIRCKGFLAGEWEMWLRKQLYYAEVLKDDTVIENVFYVPYVATDTHHGVAIEKVGANHQSSANHNGGNSTTAYVWKEAIEDFATDLYKVKDPIITVDYEESQKLLELAQDTFAGILNVRRRHRWWHSLCLTKDYIHLRGFENMLYDFYDYPDELNALLERLTDIYEMKLDYLEQHNLLAPNTGASYIGSGGWGYTSQLRHFEADEVEAIGVTTMDMWAHLESQETGEVSPEMFAAYVFPHQLRLAKRFGLVCYGCCEAVDPRWEVVRKIPNLRRVSVSPWANPYKMAEYLGHDYVYSYKPSPTMLAVPNMDEDEVRKNARDLLQITKNCNMEFIMKDNHTLGNNPRNASRWVEIVREEIERMD